MEKRKKMNSNEIYESITDAFNKLKLLKKNKNTFEAYVLAISLLEDRLNAIFYKKCQNDNIINDFKNYISIGSIIKYLKFANIIDDAMFISLKRIFSERNSVLHGYFINNKFVTQAVVDDIITRFRTLDKIQKKQKQVKK